VKILSIDTSGQQATAAIIDNYITVGEILLNARTGEKSWTHSEILMPGINSMFSLTGLGTKDIDYIAYTSGPGSFTGLRIGASTALGLARGLGKPVIAVPTLDALAYNVPVGNILPMMDARRGQVYFAVYDGVKRVTDYLAQPVSEAIDVLKNSIPQGENVFFLGDGADAYKNEICEKFPTALFVKQNLNRVRASSIGVWALENLDKAQDASDNVEILYVRAPQAVRDAKV